MIRVLVRGGGDLGSGVALRLHKAGLGVVISEIPQPLVLRRTVAFANAIYLGRMQVEDVLSQRVDKHKEALILLEQKIIPVLVEPQPDTVQLSSYQIIVDARMLKQAVPYQLSDSPFIIGLGPGFTAKKNCHAAIETNRGHYLGRVILEGSPESDTRKPGKIAGHEFERVIRAPIDGFIHSGLELGTFINEGDIVASIDNTPVKAPINGLLRGLMHDGICVSQGLKIGDIDPRTDEKLLSFVSEKSMAIAGGVMEAILTTGRFHIWN